MVGTKILGVLILSLLFIFPQSSTFAHVLESDGSIGAVVHITPDDDPIVGEQSGFFFEFKDKENKFKPELCNCTFSIIQAGQELYSQPLFQTSSEPSLTNVSVFYTFPERNIYTVKITGKPVTPNAFQPFTLSYDIRVEREADPQVSNESPTSLSSWVERHTFHIMGVVVILGVVSYAFYVNQLKKVGKKHAQK